MIGQTELIPILVSMMTWKDRLADRDVIVFLDNPSAIQCLVRGYSSRIASAKIVDTVFDWRMRLAGTRWWFTRVPTVCNVADPASRAKMSDVVAVCPNVQVVTAVVPSDW